MTAARIVTSSTDTQPEIVPPSARHRWWAVPLTVASFVVLLAVALSSLIPASLVADNEDTRREGADLEATPFAIVPGSAQPVADRVRFDGLPDDVPVFPVTNDVYFVTISEPAQSVLSWVIGRDEPVIRWLTEVEKYGTQSPSERRQQSLQMMATSEDVAKYVALDAAGYDPEVVALGLEVESTCLVPAPNDGCDREAPSAEFLEAGDVILTVDGNEVKSTGDLTRLLADKQPGDTVEIAVRRGDEELTDEIELIAGVDDPNRTIIGFLPFEPIDIELPFDVDIDTGSIGGPSAGAAFTITLLDQLTAGDLTGPDDVAITGTIALDGTIGAIGGLTQKAEAVRQAGVDVFLVPAGQSEAEISAARQAGDGIEIVPVANLDEALAALEARGGDPIPS
jgi:PDZ domain-containing protein